MVAHPSRDDKQAEAALWPHIVDDYARTRPEAIYGLWPVASDSYDEGFQSVTYSQLANIVNGLAWWIVKQIGPGASQHGDVLTYVGLNDVRLTAMILASVKAGYTVRLTLHTAILEYLTRLRNVLIRVC